MPTASRMPNAAHATAIRMLVSRSAATGAAGARSSASSVRPYAPTIATPATSARGVSSRRTATRPRRGSTARGVDDGRHAHDDLQVGQRRGVLQPVVVDHGVARDDDADGEAREHVRAARAGSEAAHQGDAGRDDDHADRLEAARAAADQRGAEEHEDGGAAAGDRVDDRELGAPVGGGEEREVEQLERGADGHEGDRVGVDVPRRDGQREEQDRAHDERRRRGGRGVLPPGDVEVPARVQERGGEREQDGGGRHSRMVPARM